LQWALFVALYIGLAAGVVVVWIVFPSGFLIGFLVLSLIHFSGDPDNGVSGLFRAVYAGGALVFPAYAHEAQVSELFAFLSNPATANQIASFLHGLSYPWIFLAVVATLLNFKKNGQAALELLCVCLLALLTPPLVSFTVFFCFMHGLRHFLRTRDYVVPASFKHLFRLGCAPIVATAVLMAFAWYGLKAVTIEAHLIQWLFISLAALTVPHMLLVDRLKFLP
jgi:Brp/Blh family beta-carotene 15,15'-monooxygenase